MKVRILERFEHDDQGMWAIFRELTFTPGDPLPTLGEPIRELVLGLV